MPAHAKPDRSSTPAHAGASAEVHDEHELADILALALAAADDAGPVSHTHVRTFRATTRAAGIRLRAWRQPPEGRIRGAVAAMILPGRVGIMLMPAVDGLGLDADGQRAALGAALAALDDAGLHYVQALLEPGDEPNRRLLVAAGFSAPTQLLYLDRDVRDAIPSADTRLIEWVAYSTTTHAQFAETLQATYEQSQDCPELFGVRPIDDVIASHRASGVFEPALWELAHEGGCPAACLLLACSAAAPVMEIVYMGVAPWARRSGWGRRLLARALVQARARTVERLALAVDERNGPARVLYAGCGFAHTATRVVMLRR